MFVSLCPLGYMSFSLQRNSAGHAAQWLFIQLSLTLFRRAAALFEDVIGLWQFHFDVGFIKRLQTAGNCLCQPNI